MEEFCILILVLFFVTNSLDKVESVQLEELDELPLQTFDELFVEEWLDNDKAEEWHKLTLEHNFHHQIDRQNTRLGQIELNSTDQNPPLTESDHSVQIEPNSTDQNLPLTEIDHFGNAKNGQEQNELSSKENITEEEGKRKIIEEFQAMKEEFKQKGKFPRKEWVQIEKKIAKHLKVNRIKIFEWKKEFGLSRKVVYEKEERKHLVEKFDQMKAELKRAGFKNSYKHEIDETVAKELGLSFMTINNWKREPDQTALNHKYAHSEQKELMQRYYEIKGNNSKISDKEIAKMLKIGSRTLVNWKKQFKRQQFHPNSVDGHFVEENAAANVQEIGNSNSACI